MRKLKKINKQLITLSLVVLVPLSLIVTSHFVAAQETSKAEKQSSSQSAGTNLAPPANDNFASATVLSSGSGILNGTNVDATKELGEPDHNGSTGGHSVWYKWTYSLSYPSGQTFNLRHAATNFDTLLAVYTGTSVNNLTRIASNDDYGSTPTSLTSTVFFPTTPGTTYYIAVDGFGNGSGIFDLKWEVNRTHTSISRYAGTSSSNVSVFRPSIGTWYLYSSNGFQTIQFGQNGDTPVPSDYDGDQITDYAVFRPSIGRWYVLQSRTSTLRVVQFGQNGDKPMPGDYNANGYADFVVFRPSNGTWYVLESRTNVFSAAQFGQNGDKPASRDFDSDGQLDFTVFRPSNGTWYILNSLDNSLKAQQWGTSEDIPVPGGYLTTGRADIAVWRPSNGTWYVYLSHDNSVVTRQFGQSGDIPQPLDFNNNSISNFGVFRPSTGTWYIQDFNGQFWVVPFGQNGDIPTAMAYPIQQ